MAEADVPYTIVGPFALVGFRLHHPDEEDDAEWPTDSDIDLVGRLQALLRMEVYVVRIVVGKNKVDRMVCCFANWNDSYYDCDEIMQIPIPEHFAKIVPKLCEVRGGIRRMFVREAKLLRWELDLLDLPPMNGSVGEAQPQSDLGINTQADRCSLGDEHTIGTESIRSPGSTPPIHRLSTEILLEISDRLLLALGNNTLRDRQNCAFTLSHIDSKLRAVMLSNSKLWTSIFITNMRSSWERAELCYHRSGRRSLHVEIAFSRAPTDVQSITTPLSSVALRLKSLVVRPTPESQAQLGFTLNQINMPNLKALTLSSAKPREPWVLSRLPRLPNLQNLSLHGVHYACNPTQFPNLIALHWDGCEVWSNPHVDVEQTLGSISHIKSLQNLTLRGFSCDVPEHPKPALQLPALRDLDIDLRNSEYTFYFLSNLDTPSLQNLTLDCSFLESVHDNDIEIPPLTRRYPQVVSLEVLGFHHAWELDQNVAASIARHFPNISSLKLHGCAFLDVLTSAAEDYLAQNGAQQENPLLLSRLSRMELTWQRGQHHSYQEAERAVSFLNYRMKLGYPLLPQLYIKHQAKQKPDTELARKKGVTMQPGIANTPLIKEIEELVEDFRYEYVYMDDLVV